MIAPRTRHIYIATLHPLGIAGAPFVVQLHPFPLTVSGLVVMLTRCLTDKVIPDALHAFSAELMSMLKDCDMEIIKRNLAMLRDKRDRMAAMHVEGRKWLVSFQSLEIVE